MTHAPSKKMYSTPEVGEQKIIKNAGFLYMCNIIVTDELDVFHH